MDDKTLDVTKVSEAQAKISDIKVFGDGDTFALLCKASSESQGWMKSTKVCNVEGGCIVQVTTQQKNPDGSYAVAEALTYVPGVQMDKQCHPPQLTAISQPLHGTFNASYERTKADQIGYYLQHLYEAQRSGHEVHQEIDEALKLFKEATGI